MRRLVTIRFWRHDGWRLAIALVCASFLVVGGVALRAHDTQQLDARICLRVDRVDGVIVALLERSQKGLPSNPFYKEHPELLANAQREIARSLRDFRGASC
jgi:hypothetical protein